MEDKATLVCIRQRDREYHGRRMDMNTISDGIESGVSTTADSKEIIVEQIEKLQEKDTKNFGIQNDVSNRQQQGRPPSIQSATQGQFILP